MVLERFAVGEGPDCGQGSTALAMLTSSDPQFERDRAKYFIGSPDASARNATSARPARVLTLTPAQRRALEAALDNQSKLVVPDIMSRGTARITYDFQAFNLAPDGFPRLFVRTRLHFPRRSMPGLSLWMRMEGDQFVVERSDSWLVRLAATEKDPIAIEMRRPDKETAGVVFNAIAGPDGWGWLVMGQRGWESISTIAYRYSPDGPVPLPLALHLGC
jgi:hypothetical protein